MSWSLREVLSFFVALLPILPARIIRMRAKRLRPIVVYTDAMYTDSDTPPGRIGIVIYDPEAPEPGRDAGEAPDSVDFRWRHASAEVTRRDLESMDQRKQYIT